MCLKNEVNVWVHFDPRVGRVKHQEKVLSIDKAEEVQLSEGIGGDRVHKVLNFVLVITYRLSPLRICSKHGKVLSSSCWSQQEVTARVTTPAQGFSREVGGNSSSN